MNQNIFPNHIQWQVDQLFKEFRDQLGQFAMFKEIGWRPTLVVRAQGHMSDDFREILKKILGPDWEIRFETMRT